ncbi:DUF1559 domain-containing protein [Leptolyngbya sp. 15MV]|nr:DUF1559 domain-containing protein [Leptolyngbya sp. 15MV]
MRREVVVARAFTMIDVLVSLAVVAVLISLLLPSLGLVRESANQVMCRSNLRQIGLGLALYAEANGDRVVPSTKVRGDLMNDSPWETDLLRLAPPGAAWDGLGILYGAEYLPAPKLFYCPSHKGAARYAAYEDQWGGKPGEIRGNFQYRGRAPAERLDRPAPMMANAGGRSAPQPTVPLTLFLSAMRPGSALAVDGIRNADAVNHRHGANVLRAGLSVTWFDDAQKNVLGILPKGSPATSSQLDLIWTELDRGAPED